MSDTSTDTIALHLEGNFPSEAQKSASAASALAEALGKMQAATEAAKDPQVIAAGKLNAITSELNAQAAITAKIAAFDANRVRELVAAEAQYKKMREDALGITAEREKQARLAKQEEEAAKIRAKWAESARAVDRDVKFADAQNAAAMERAAGAVAHGGEVVLAAAVALAAAGAALVASGYKEAVGVTSRHEVQNAVGTKLGGDYEQTVKMALRMGIDPEQAWTETKKLLNAKFSKDEIPALLRIKAGMDLAGLDGDALLKKLETIKLGSKVGTKDVEGLKKLGVDVGEVYAEIARKTGKSMDIVKAEVKAGTMEASQVVAAIEKVAGGKFGSLADTLGGSVPALIARLKGEFEEMFNIGPETLGPIKNVLKNMLDIMEGPGGAEVKGAIKELFGAINDTFLGPLQGEEGKRRIAEFAHGAADAIHEMAGAVREVKPLIVDMMDAGGPALELLADFFRGLAVTIREVKDITDATLHSLSKLGLVDDPFAEKKKGPAHDDPSTFVESADSKRAAAAAAGAELPAGMAEGIMGGESEAIEAAGAMADKALQEAKDRLGVRSPSEEFGEVGGYSAEGMALGMANHPGPAEAGRRMAGNALDAARGAAGGGAGTPGGAGAGGDVNITIQVQGAGGGASAAQEWEALVPVIETTIRRIRRDRLESAGGAP